MDAGCAGPAGEGVRVLEGGEVDCGAGWSVLWFKRLEAEGDNSGGRRCGHELCERARLDSALVWWVRPNDRLVATFTVVAGECPLLQSGQSRTITQMFLKSAIYVASYPRAGRRLFALSVSCAVL